MFQSQTLRLAGNNHRERASICSVQPGLIGRRLLAAMAGVAAIAAVAALPRHVAQPSADSAILPQTILLQAETPAILRDRGEAFRAEMLAGPGVRAVTIEGLRQQSLSAADGGLRPVEHNASYTNRP